MKLTIKGRGKGKTLALIEESFKTGSHMVVFSQSEAYRIRKIVEEKYPNKKFPRIFTFDDFESNQLRGFHEDFLVDNADLFLQRIFKGRLSGISLNLEE